MNALALQPLGAGVVGVYLRSSGAHVGHLKWIGGRWKFKALGWESGALVPGGGPLTARHNTCFAALDEASVSAALWPGAAPLP